MSKLAIICNGREPCNLYPTFMMGAAAAALGDEVLLFFTPTAAPALVRGELEKIEGKGLPPMRELVGSLDDLGCRVLVCELCLEAQGLREEDFRDGVELIGVTAFLATSRDAARTLCF